MNLSWKTILAVPLASLSVVLAPSTFGHDGKLTFAPVLQKATPAVVNIDVSGESQAAVPLFGDPRLRRFFEGQPMPRRGSGAGVIIDAKEGYVVTNHHVIDDADEIVVTLQDRREFVAELIGSDPDTDIALLKIDAPDLEALPLGDSDALAVGDFVIAIGNPFDFGHTVTSGIVSALGRGGFNRQGYEDFIQTDAAINRGNSGGALVDLDGRLVGINTAIVTPTGANAGLGFAVPSNIVKVITAQLLEFGETRRGYLGVSIDDVRPEDAQALGLTSATGVVVGEVMDDSSAQAAGIEPGDVIVSLDGEDVIDVRDLRARVGLAQIGDSVKVGVIREGKEREIDATIGEMGSAETVSTVLPRLAGASWRNLSRGHELHGRVRGVELVDVEVNSPAWNVGLRPGDVILRVNRRTVEDVDDLEAALAGRGAVGLLIQRGERRLFTIVR